MKDTETIRLFDNGEVVIDYIYDYNDNKPMLLDHYDKIDETGARYTGFAFADGDELYMEEMRNDTKIIGNVYGNDDMIWKWYWDEDGYLRCQIIKHQL